MIEYLTIPTQGRPIRIREDEWHQLFYASNAHGAVTIYRNKKNEQKHIVRIQWEGKHAAQHGTADLRGSIASVGMYVGMTDAQISKLTADILDVEYI